MVHLRFVLLEAYGERRASHAEGWALMGTSNAYGGAGGATPLIPSWLQGDGDGGAGAAGAMATGHNPRHPMDRPQPFLPRQRLGQSRR